MSALASHAKDNSTEFHYTDLLLQCMQQRCELLEALRTLAESQAMNVDQTEIDLTLSVLGRKQALFEELAEVQQKLQPYLQDDPESRLWSSAEQRHQCRQLAQRGQQLLQETMHIEQQTLQEMTSRRDAVAAQLQDGQDSILAQTAYQADSLLGAGVLDIADL